MSGKVTRLTLDQPWLTSCDLLLSVARQHHRVRAERRGHAGPGGASHARQRQSFDLDGMYGGLQTGRWLIITGERTGLPGVTTGEVGHGGGHDPGRRPARGHGAHNRAACRPPWPTPTCAAPSPSGATWWPRPRAPPSRTCSAAARPARPGRASRSAAARSPTCRRPRPPGPASTLDHLRQRGVLAGSRQPGLGRARPTTCT